MSQVSTKMVDATKIKQGLNSNDKTVSTIFHSVHACFSRRLAKRLQLQVQSELF